MQAASGAKQMKRAVERVSVTVGSKQYEVGVSQLSKTVWQAVGDYEGERITVGDRSAAAAITKWKETARYRDSAGRASE